MSRPVTSPLTRRARAHLATASAAAASLFALAGCGAGVDAQTAEFYSPGDGVNAIAGDMRVLNALVVAPGEGGQDAVISMMVANDGTQPQAITEVLSDRFGPARITGERTVPARGAILYGVEGVQGRAILPGFTGKAGETVTLTVRFARNRPIDNLQTVILPPTGYYGDLKVQPAPPASPVITEPPITGPPPTGGRQAPVNPAGSPPVTDPAGVATGGAEVNNP